MRPFTASVAFLCLGVIWCSVSRAKDEITSMPVRDGDGSQIATIDSSGEWISQKVDGSNLHIAEPVRAVSSPSEQRTPVSAAAGEVSLNTIDKINLASYSTESYSLTYGMTIGGRVSTYNLSDGSSWSSGAGSSTSGSMKFDRLETDGSVGHFYFTHNDLLLRKTDYNSGSHSANFELHVDGPLVIVATLGSRQGVLQGRALIVSDQPANYNDSRFNYLTAIQGKKKGLESSPSLFDASLA